VLGIEARVRALLSDGQTADCCYRDSIKRLDQTPIQAELARSHLLYGEWLRRQGRRMDAREQLRTAHQMLDTMGMEAFADRARRELAATGETARTRTAPAARTAGEPLTTQEAQVARLARDGLSNPEIGARLFISAHGPVPPGQGVHQARHRLPQPARPGPARRPGHRLAALARPFRAAPGPATSAQIL
jgi:ATP/maltotriose-dependent transcriptional regulator MalT